MGTINKQLFQPTNLSTRYINRHRLNNIFDQAADCKMIYIIAGAGFGKTQAARHYFDQKQNIIVRWMQITECDNAVSRFWKNIIEIISLDNQDLANKLSSLGFPKALTQFKQFIEIMTYMENHSKKTFLVFDDFHLINSDEILTFLERCAHVQIPSVCFVIISRKEPEINVASLHSKGSISVITDEDLRFTMEEIAEFFQLQTIRLSSQDISQLMDMTKGWALAINIFSVMMKWMSNNFKHAMDVMRQNIFNLFETEAWNGLSKPMQKTLVKMSLLLELPIVDFQKKSANADIELLSSVPGIMSFITNPLYREFLQAKRHILSRAEKQKTYERAAKWCLEYDYHIDAMYYCAKSHQFEQMVQMFFSYSFKLPRDTSEQFLNILESLDLKTEEQGDENVIILKNYFTPLLLAGSGRYEEARDRALAVIKEWEYKDGPLADMLLCNSYNSLSYFDMFLCTKTHEYKSPSYLRKSAEYLIHISNHSSKVSRAFINGELRYYASLVGEGADLAEFDQFLEVVKQAELLVRETPFQVYSGYAELVACEYAFFKNQPEVARTHAYNAILKAREKQQYSIEMVAENYLLHIAMYEGNYSLVMELLNQLHAHLSCTDFWNRQLYYDFYAGIFYAKLGFLNKVPRWLVTDEKNTMPVFHNPVAELYINVLHEISAQKYNQALTILCNSYPRNPEDRFLFGELQFLLLTAVARIQTGDTEGAMADFERAYELSFNGTFEMFFIELGKELHPLILAALKQKKYGIPSEWLKKIDCKATIYTKKLTVVANALRDKTDTKKHTQLPKREQEVLIDLSHGLSRDEIAKYRNLSVNTVKKLLNSIYIRLDARNNADAVRIAYERKLIE